ncbi:MAG: hypothetical protein K8R88_10260 [Armatimonadetes bacterium]|nr:hypothetical protein [Armatimonadota bacterium]
MYLTPPDQRLATRVLEKLGHLDMLPVMVKRWNSFVYEISEGEIPDLYEYEIDIEARGSLDEVCSKLSKLGAIVLQQALHNSDEAFKELTFDASEPGQNRWNRYPLQAPHEFLADLRSQGIEVA